MAKHILVVEDEQNLAEALKEHLEKKGFTAETVTSGEAALTAMNNTAPDLILLDIALPGMSGFDLLDQIQEMRAEKHTPVIMLSNLDNPDDLRRAHHYDVSEYLIKTDWRLDDVVKKIEKAL